MKKLLWVAGLAVLGLRAPLLAEEKPPELEILERDAKGRVTKVRLEDLVVDVCTPERTDGCVNPAEIGLDQGNRPIDYWPGKPASEIDEPLPAEQADEQDEG